MASKARKLHRVNECAQRPDDVIFDTASDASAGAPNMPDQVTLKRPSTNELFAQQQRPIHAITKAIVRENIKLYFIIYADDIENGRFVKESDLTQAERQYVQQNSDKIKILRSKPKIPQNLYTE